jgi:hypothetical protein
MSKSAFCRLVDEVCSSCGIPDSPSNYERFNLTTRGVAFTLAHAGALDDASLVFFCDFGPLAEDTPLQVFRRLLELNLLALGKNNPRIGMDPEGGNVVLAGLLPLSPDMTPEKLLDELEHYATLALTWRDQHDLQDPNKASRAAFKGSVTHRALGSARQGKTNRGKPAQAPIARNDPD